MTPLYPPEFVSEARAFPGTVIGLDLEKDPTGCPNCGGGGLMHAFFIESNHARKGVVQKWSEERNEWLYGRTKSAPCPVCNGEAKAHYLQENCGLEGTALERRLSDFKALEGKEKAKEVAGYLLGLNLQPHGFVTYHGLYGRGKTHLLYALVNGYRAVGLLAQYTTMADLLASVRDQFDSGANAAEHLLTRYRNCKALLLDEVDRVNLTPWAKETIFRLLDGRYTQSKFMLTVLATNTAPEAMTGDWLYLASRMKAGLVVEVGGVDVREAIGKKEQELWYQK